MISRYESISSLRKFIFFRYARLLPMLILVSIWNLAIYKSLNISSVNIIPAILIIDPQILNVAFRTEVFRWIDDSFWTLFVEIRFYILFGLIIKLLGSNSLFVKKVTLLAVCMLSQILFLLSSIFDYDVVNQLCFWFLFPNYFTYFIIGILFYNPQTFKRAHFVIILSLLAITQLGIQLTGSGFTWDTLFSEYSLVYVAYFVSILLVFPFSRYAICIFPNLRWVSNIIGYPSYVIYLLHQNLFLFAFPNLSVQYDHLVIACSLYMIIVFSSLLLVNRVEPKLIQIVKSLGLD